MANTIASPNMNLPIPVIGVDPSPQWAQDVNSSLTIVDGHNHTAGYGVPIPPSGLNINADLTFNAQNATNLRSVRFSPQVSPISGATDIGCLYESGVDLYFNDGSGNQVRITQSGGVAGTSGSIANLTSPASATYVALSQTFVWQSAANTPANMDNASITLRNLVANSKGLTLNPPNAMGADYSLTLPSLPPAQQIMTLDNSGNMAAPYTVDGTTIAIAANVIGVPTAGINTAQLADGSVTNPKLAALNVVESASSGVFVTNTATFTNVTNLSVTITTSGRPVFVGMVHDGTGALVGSYIKAASTTSGTAATTYISMVRNATQIYGTTLESVVGSSLLPSISIPATSVYQIDMPTAGTYTYVVEARPLNTGTITTVANAKLIAYEL